MLVRSPEPALVGRPPPGIVAHLESRGRHRHFVAGEVVLPQDEPGSCVHVVVRGYVRVERVYPGLFATMVLAEAGPGDVVGAAGVLFGDLRATTATAIEETDTIEVHSEALRELLAEKLQEAADLVQLLGQRDWATMQPAEQPGCAARRRSRRGGGRHARTPAAADAAGDDSTS